MRVLGIIPARMGSSRFPGKPLAKIGGQAMIARVVGQVLKAKTVSKIVVATDSKEIAAAVQDFSVEVVFTSENCPSGTDRCIEAFSKLGEEADYIVNIQGDEPFIAPQQIDDLVEFMHLHKAEIGTLCKRIESEQALWDPSVVKLVKAPSGKALYFSRQTIPYLRDLPSQKWLEAGRHFRHVGMYGFHTSVLSKLANLPQSKLELAEQLEQLRWLEAGFQIYVAETEFDTIGIDTPEDLKQAERYLSGL